MDLRGRIPEPGRRLGSRAATFGSHAATRVRSSTRRRPVPGLLSFVVPVYKVERYLDECLLSLRTQEYAEVEIVCVDDGSPDDSVSIVRRHMLRDPRVRLVRRPNGGLSAARNTGVRAARGEFLAFVDSDDTVPPTGYRVAVESLRRSGSDFAVLPYQRLKKDQLTPPASWIRDVHARARTAITVDDFPGVLANAIICSKVFRRDFWDRTGLGFVEGIIYEDQQVSAEAYARARSFDVLTAYLYNWRMRLDQSSISQAKGDVSNLRAQFAAANESLRVLERHASPPVVEARVLQLLSNDMPQFTARVVGCSDAYWELLREELPLLLDRVDREEYLSRVPPQQKVLQHLVVTGQRARAERFVELGGLTVRNAEAAREEVGLVLRLPLWRDPASRVPDECFRVAERQTRPRTSLRGIALRTPSEVELSCWAFVENVDLAETPLAVRAFAVRPEGAPDAGAEVELGVESGADDAIDELDVPGSGFADYRRGAHRVRLDLAALASGTWQVRLELSVGRLTRSALLGEPWVAGTAALRHAARGADGRPVVLAAARRAPLEVRVHDDRTVVEGVRVDAGRVLLDGAGDRPEAVLLRRVGGGEPGEAAVRTALRGGGGAWSAEVALPVAATGPASATWEVRAVVDGRERPLRHAPRAVLADVRAEDARVTAVPGAHDGLHLTLHRPVAVVRGVDVGDDGVTLRLDTDGIAAGDYEAVLESRPATVAASLEPDPSGGDGRLVVRVPFRHERWGVPDVVLPSADYKVALRHRATGAEVVPRVVAPLLHELPADHLVGPVRCRLHLRPATRGLVVALGPPLPPEARGVRNQLRLQALANHGAADERAVFFRSLYGEVANDSAAAVHAELRRRGSDLTLYWSVADSSVQVPEGGVPVLEGTREWHERLGAARYVMVNVHQPMWYRKPAGQVMVQTFHGYPYKGMGRTWWERSDLPASRITSLLDRAAAWDHLVSPSSYATPHLLSAFFRPEDVAGVNVVEAGYPRNDVLLDDEGRVVRERVRKALGIRDDQVAVLYAPTFRDYLSTDGMTARSGDFFDPYAAAAELGPAYVVLVRGHAFHARARTERHRGENVVDVTYHPDVAELCLASDAAVLDYSSLRFDYALLRRPMVFLVPDEEEYHLNRPAIMPYPPTAPGPRVATTGEVVRLLRDPEQLRRTYADAVERFIATYLELEDGHAAARVVDAVFDPADAGQRT